MTILIYQTDSYQKEFAATVSAIDEEQNAVQLTETVFYPGGGGQPADRGTLTAEDNVYPVTKVKRGNWHIIDGALPAVGTPVQGEIDWDYRYKLMRTHTAMHVLCGVVWRDYGASVTGGSMEAMKGRMDFEFERMQKELVDKIQDRINTEVAAARDVIIKILPRDEAFEIPDLIRTKINLLPDAIQEVRTVELVGLDLQACGGTHLKNTQEVGTIKITNYKSKGGINKRIYIELE